MKYLAYCLLLLCTWCAGALGQNVSIQARLDRPEIKIGERAAIDLTIRTDDLARTRFYLLQDSTRGEERYRVLAFGATDTIDIGHGVQEIKAQMIVTSFDSTLITLPPIVVESPSGQAMTKPLALNVLSPQVDVSQPENIRPIVAPWDEPLTLIDLLMILFTSWIFYTIAGLLLIALLIYEYRRRARHPEIVKPEPEAPPVPLLEQLKAQLATLDNARLETQEMTTDEVIETLRSQPLSGEQLARLEHILSGASFVKFAKSLPTQGDALSMRKASLSLAESIEATLTAHEAQAKERKEVKR